MQNDKIESTTPVDKSTMDPKIFPFDRTPDLSL